MERNRKERIGFCRPMHKSATLLSRHFGGATLTKHAPWGTIGIRPHVYQGFTLFGHLHTVYATIFAYVVARFIILRPLFSHFYTLIFAYLVARCIMFRLSRVQHFSVGTMKVSALQNMHPEVSSATGPMFIRGSPLFGNFYTVYTPIFAYFVARGILFRLIRVVHFSGGAMAMSPLQNMHTEGCSASGSMFIRGSPLFVDFYTFTPHICIFSRPMYNFPPHKSATFSSRHYESVTSTFSLSTPPFWHI